MAGNGIPSLRTILLAMTRWKTNINFAIISITIHQDSGGPTTVQFSHKKASIHLRLMGRTVEKSARLRGTNSNTEQDG